MRGTDVTRGRWSGSSPRGTIHLDASLTEIVAAVTAIGGMCGLSVKYLVDRVSARQTALEKRQADEKIQRDAERAHHELKVEQERIRWEAVMTDRMSEMRREIRLQEHEISYLRVVSDAYLRHIAALEGLMRAAGISIPVLHVPEYRPVAIDDDGDDRRGRRQVEAC